MSLNLLLKNVEIVSPADGLNEIADILIIDGTIRKIGNITKSRKNVEELDLKGKTCVPGFFDMHVHFREPGQTHKENINTGSEAAMNGGFTGVMMMPNTNPPLDSPVLVSSLREKYKTGLLDLEIAACATQNREGEKLSPILSLKEAGAAGFTDDGSPVNNSELVRRIFEYTAQCNSVFIQHCEDMNLTNHGVMNEGFISTTLGLWGIPSIGETTIITRDIEISEFVNNSRYHVQHISCGRSVELVRDAKKRKLNVTAEACPHHFILTDKECLNYNVNAKMNPPLRTKEDVESILEGLKDDTIDVICTDHAPHTEYEKEQGFNDAPFGIIGLETAIGLSYTFLVKTGIIPFEKMVEKFSNNPRKILNLESVNIKEGEVANLTLLERKKKWKVNKKYFKSKSKNTPFDGFNLECMQFCVINNNQIYYSQL